MKVEPNGFHDQSSTKHPIQQHHLKAALISIKKATQFTNSVQILLLERLAIHPGAVPPWRMGWFTEKYPEEEMKLFLASMTSADEAAGALAHSVVRYSISERVLGHAIPPARRGFASAFSLARHWSAH